jgi:hypothetical protein
VERVDAVGPIWAQCVPASHECRVVAQFLSTKDGLALAKTYMAIRDNAVRKRVVELVMPHCGLVHCQFVSNACDQRNAADERKKHRDEMGRLPDFVAEICHSK